MADTQRRDPGRITPHFALVFLSALGLTLLCGAAMVVLSIFGEETEAMKSAVGTCSDMFKMGVGAVLGLIGGKAASR
jgi:hypothetical protein